MMITLETSTVNAIVATRIAGHLPDQELKTHILREMTLILHGHYSKFS